MSASKIRVLFKSVEVVRGAGLVGPGEWSFEAKVRRLPSDKAVSVGKSKKTFEAKEGRTISLNWSTDLEIEPGDKTLEIRLQGTDDDAIAGKENDLGWVRFKLNLPIVQEYDLRLRSSVGHFTARVQVRMRKSTPRFLRRITTVRQHSESKTFSTIHEEMRSKMVHVCPVIPVPWATGIPPIPVGVRKLSASPQVNLAIGTADTKPNSLVNPTLIPAIGTSESGFEDQCARIRITQYRPADLDLTKVIWKAATGNIKFWHEGASKTEVKGGQEVKAYGVPGGSDDKEGKIEVRWDGEGQPLLAVYRAWVGKIKYVPCRANIIKCSTARIGGVPVKNPTFTPAQVKKHVDYTNVLLWQSGVQLVMDKDKTVYNGAVQKQDGIFEINSASNHTFNVAMDRRIVAPLLNSRGGVFNLVYVHSCRGIPNLLGAATDRAVSKAEATVSLGGTPSTSWIRPSGLWPDSDSKKVKMKRMGPSTARNKNQKALCGDGAIDKICACLITNNDNIANGSVTLAHELGHVLGLHHRGSGGNQAVKSYDKVNHMAGPRKGRGHPWDENLMTYGSDAEAQDIDMIQAMVVREHPLCKDSAPKPKPAPARRPVPTAGTPRKKDIILMQEYLADTRKGLRNTGYNLGKTGPALDGVDSIYGVKTRSAVRFFQRDHGGLKVDGIYGPNTCAAFDAEINGVA